jgi:DNA-binding transcriptional MerR regulator
VRYKGANIAVERPLLGEKQMQNTKKYYRIGEFARKVGVSHDFLKYQEEFGVVDPSLRQNSNYRYYAFAQVGRVFASIGLQNLGFTLRQIEAILGQDDAEAIRQKLASKSHELQDEQSRLNAYQSATDMICRALVTEKDPNPWFVEHIDSFAFLPHSSRQELVDDERLLATLQSWLQWLPAVSSAQSIQGNLSSDGILRAASFSWGLMVGSGFAQTHGLELDYPIETIPPARALSYYQGLVIDQAATDDADQTLAAVLEAPLSVAKSHNLPITGQIYHRVLFYSNEAGQRKLHSIIYLLLA